MKETVSKTIVSTTGSTLCESNDCQYQKDCANHSSAGCHREDSGFSPILILEDNNQVVCMSSMIESDDSGYGHKKPLLHDDSGYVSTPTKKEYENLEIIECSRCSLQDKFYANSDGFDILIDKITKKIFSRCQ